MKDNNNQMKPITFIDLFSGAGGLSEGFIEAGYKLLFAIDNDKWSCETLRLNHTDAVVIQDDITKFTTEEFKKLIKDPVDVIIGGPPCQGFSPLGKRLEIDPRNRLLFEFLRFVKDLQPKVFVMENVPELLKSEEYAQFKSDAEALGYKIVAKVLLAADYGVPQKRKRAIVIGSKSFEPTHPSPTHVDPEKKNLFNSHLFAWKTVKDAIGDLPLVPNGNDLHVGRNPTEVSLARYKSIPEGGNRFNLPSELQPECWKRKLTGSVDVFGRLWWDKPSVTIRTEFFKPEKGRYLHPAANRPITLREAARLQTFPDTFIFKGSNTQVAKQIGNAVPCLLAQKIAEHIKEQLSIFEKTSKDIDNQSSHVQGTHASL